MCPIVPGFLHACDVCRKHTRRLQRYIAVLHSSSPCFTLYQGGIYKFDFLSHRIEQWHQHDCSMMCWIQLCLCEHQQIRLDKVVFDVLCFVEQYHSPERVLHYTFVDWANLYFPLFEIIRSTVLFYVVLCFDSTRITNLTFLQICNCRCVVDGTVFKLGVIMSDHNNVWTT